MKVNPEDLFQLDYVDIDLDIDKVCIPVHLERRCTRKLEQDNRYILLSPIENKVRLVTYKRKDHNSENYCFSCNGRNILTTHKDWGYNWFVIKVF